MLDWKKKASRTVTLIAVSTLIGLTGCSTVERDPTTKWDADRLYAEARAEMDIANWQRARELLERLEARFPFTRHAQQAQIEIAYAYYKEGDGAQAVTAADRFLKLNPNHPNADYVHYLKGLASFDDQMGFLGRLAGQDPSMRDPKAMREAFDAFRELLVRYPNSRYAPDSRQRMNFLINAMAQSEVNIARYYMRRGAYVAAIQRAQGALRDYQAAPAAAEALSILVSSYEALGMPDLRDDARRVLERNFPAKK